MTDIRDIEKNNPLVASYLKQINKKIQALELIVEKKSQSQVAINSRLNKRLEIVEKRGK